MHLVTDATGAITMTALGEALVAQEVSLRERSILATRANLRDDLQPCKTVRGWANRADRAEGLTIMVNSISEIEHANKTEIVPLKANYARSTYTNDGSKTEGAGREYAGIKDNAIVTRRVSRKATQTEIETSEKVSEACPTEGCEGYLHPVTMACNGGHKQGDRCCGQTFLEGGVQVIRTDVVNRYEKGMTGIVCLNFDTGALTVRTIRQRGGADKAQVNPEKWSITARWVRGEKPSWRQHHFTQATIVDEDGETIGHTVVAFPTDQMAQATESGIQVIGQGPNLFNREEAF